jgi:molybdopterin synthase sulfur carrier subunit
MKFKIRYFASLRENLGRSQEEVESTASTVGQVRDELLARGGVYLCLQRDRSVRMALNQVMVNEDAMLMDQSELAFFPPRHWRLNGESSRCDSIGRL